MSTLRPWRAWQPGVPLMDSAGFRRLLPGDLSAIVAPLFEVATTYPDHTSEKINSQLAPLFPCSSPKPEFTVRRGLPRWLSSGVVGYEQSGVGGLSDFSKRCGVRPRHHGDINESSTVEVCDGGVGRIDGGRDRRSWSVRASSGCRRRGSAGSRESMSLWWIAGVAAGASWATPDGCRRR